MNYTQELYFGTHPLDRNRERKMCFYGRVSTQHEAQLDALENQMQWYDDQKKYHPNWTVIDRYIDQGITGTLAKKRPSFMRMIEDAKKRRFDLIVTREVCRFARNTVDTLVLTRELKKYGVEVFFVEDNIWTMDNDGELRLTIMATLAQEESRKISERVRAGQQVSRENGSLYGNGNIIGYDRDNARRTYVINPEQAQTIRTIYTLYAQGLGEKAVVNELCRLGCKDGHGNVNWSCPKVSRILRNATYMGYIGYNKSKVNNFLEKKRINNLDESSYIYVKGDFEPIVSEDLWHECERIRKSRITSYRLPDGEARRKGTMATKNIWVSKLHCKCGASFRKFHWRVLKDGTPIIGFQCCKRTSAPSKSFRETNDLQSANDCNQISVCEWKLEIMAKMIFEKIWGDKKGAVLRACQMISAASALDNKSKAEARLSTEQKMAAAKRRKMSYSRMRADGELEQEDYRELCREINQEIHELENQQKSLDAEEPTNPNAVNVAHIKAALERIVELRSPKVPVELIEEFVEVVTPIEDYRYRWKLNFEGVPDTEQRTNLVEIETPPVLSFHINYEEAKRWRAECGLPTQQFRRCTWNDLVVDVFV